MKSTTFEMQPISVLLNEHFIVEIKLNIKNKRQPLNQTNTGATKKKKNRKKARIKISREKCG